MNKQQLAQKIWASANQMRSKIEANEYKDYILGFIFYKYLSDKEIKFLKENDYDDELLKTVSEEDDETVKWVQENIGYFIAYKDLFSTWLSMGKDFDVSNVRDALSAFSRLISNTHKKVFDKVFDTLQTGLSKLGDSSGSQTKAISGLLTLIKDIPMDGKQDYDVLGFIYEYLISNFAANAGKKAGEFYTPHEVSLLMSEIVASHLKGKSEIKIYDPTSGSGSLLINIGQSVAKYMTDDNNIKYFAQELKENTYNLTRMNLVMRGIKPDNIVTRNGDTLEEDWPYFDENDPVNTYNPLYVDAVVSNPPYSQAWDPSNKEGDPRYARFGLAPKGKADYAFLLHDLFHIKPDGIMTIVLPHGVLFRGGEEGEIRKNLIENMLSIIKETFPNAIFFGFTGTPVFEENAKKNNAQTDVFGNELHRYSIADGIRDKNVLGFDPYKVLTFRDKDVRKVVALEKAKAATEEEAISDPKKAKIFYEYMDSSTVKMAGFLGDDGKWVKGIEDYLPKTQYLSSEHQSKVVEDIQENWLTLSHNGKFHAIFATSSIPEAIDYYRLLKAAMPKLRISCLFDPNISNEDGDYKEYRGQPIAFYKEQGLIEILTDYNTMFGQDFSIATHARFKKDLSLRLAHKEQYKRVEREPEKQLDLLIVVDQMLTGFDSKWVNTLYMDKILEYENIIQAFSRTNRLFGPDKPFGIIRYYRKPHTMEQNVSKAVKLYSGDRPIGLFVEKLSYNLGKLNAVFDDIAYLFKNAGIPDFEKLPADGTVRAKFASLFRDFNGYLEAAKIQGFRWDKHTYSFKDEESGNSIEITMEFDENAFLILAQRYKELSAASPDDPGSQDIDIPYDLVGYLTEIDTGVIDADYMNSRFDKYLKLIRQEGSSEESIEQAKAELHKTFAALTQEEQKYANIFLHDIERGDVIAEDGKTLRDYITEYQFRAKDDQIHRFATIFGLDEDKLRNMMGLNLNEATINEFGRFDELKKSVDKTKAKAFFEAYEQTKLIPPKVNMKTDQLLRQFILTGGFEVDMP